jgi:lipopolysaccharide export system permease protein
MRTLDRYVSVLFLRNLAIILAVLVSLYGLIEFIEKIDDFISNQVALPNYFLYPLCNLPVMLEHSLPMGILLATFVTVGQLSRTSQITALRSCGIGLWQMTRPLFVCGLFICLLAVLGGAWLTPWSARESRSIFITKVKGDTIIAPSTEDIYFRDKQRIISASESFPEQKELHGLSVLEFNNNFHLTRHLEATVAHHREGTNWLLTNVVERSFKADTQALESFARHRELSMDLGRKPEEMTEIWYKPQEIPLGELWQLDQKLQFQGGDYLPYRIEWQQRLARSLTPLLMVLTGIPFALHRGRQASVGLGIGISLAVFTGYFACQAVGMALGSAGLLPVPLAVWVANVLLLLVGSWLFLTLDN